jgi:hypothetical protein
MLTSSVMCVWMCISLSLSLSLYIYIYIYICVFRVLSLPQWNIKFPKVFKFVTAAFNSVIIASIEKVNISALCRYKIMN